MVRPANVGGSHGHEAPGHEGGARRALKRQYEQEEEMESEADEGVPLSKVASPRTPIMDLATLIPAGNDQVVNIWASGTQFMASCGCGGNPSKMSMRNDFLELLPVDERKVAEVSTMVIVDANGPAEAKPSSDNIVTGHCGTHPVILQQMLDFKSFSEHICCQLEAQWPKRIMNSAQDAIAILVYSTAGRHRSVAWSYLIQVFLLAKGYHVHVSEAAVNQEGIRGPQCSECHGPMAHSVLNQAIAMLSSVQP